MTKIVLFNGPPKCGKDEASDILSWHILYHAENYGRVVKTMFKRKLYEVTACLYNTNIDEFIRLATDRVTKETPIEELGWLSPRQAMIHVSEDIIKPNFGKRYFGDSAVSYIESIGVEPYFVLFSDSGFVEEAEPIVERFGVDNCTVVRIKGRSTYEEFNDSRRFLDESDLPGVEFIDIENTGTLEEFRESIMRLGDRVLGENLREENELGHC